MSATPTHDAEQRPPPRSAEVDQCKRRVGAGDQDGKVVYTAKAGRTSKSFPALEWLAAMCSHIPNRGEQIVRSQGYYSNISQGKRQKEGRITPSPEFSNRRGMKESSAGIGRA